MKRYRKEDMLLFHEVLKEIYLNSKILETEQYIQHGNTSLLDHSILVALLSYRIAILFHFPVDERKLIRGAMLHDYFLYDWHNNGHSLHGFKHPKIALRNAQRDLEISDIEKDIIVKHMFPLTPVPPKYIESAVVCIADKICSLYETLYLNSLFKKFTTR